jgi:hypothetical protein
MTESKKESLDDMDLVEDPNLVRILEKMDRRIKKLERICKNLKAAARTSDNGKYQLQGDYIGDLE